MIKLYVTKPGKSYTEYVIVRDGKRICKHSSAEKMIHNHNWNFRAREYNSPRLHEDYDYLTWAMSEKGIRNYLRDNFPEEFI